jgi:hypothetical protein
MVMVERSTRQLALPFKDDRELLKSPMRRQCGASFDRFSERSKTQSNLFAAGLHGTR